MTKNILFIMFDQLRFDYLSCAGHPHLQTPHIDRLAGLGVRFTNCYVQSPICGASRMSFYTGRYVHSHGAAWNNFPLKVGERTLGDHLREIGMEAWLIGKTHMKADEQGMKILGLSEDGVIGARVAQCGFDVFERDDGLWPEGPDGPYDTKPSPYNDYLKSTGYKGENPWHDYANSALEGEDEIASGWLMQNAGKPANVAEEDSETAWLTSRAIDFVDSHAHGAPWLCHLSYIKPHWPYIAPSPYHDMYGPNQVTPVQRRDTELDDPHPVYAQFTKNAVGRAFARDEVRRAVIPTYMGLIKQCDDQLGRLFAHLEATGRMQDTMIVVTSDHGDYLGDHWLGEKGLFHEASVKIPLIVYDPSPEADATRGTTCDALVESIDLAATFIEAAGGEVPGHIVEGRSLLPFLQGTPPAEWRDYAISEYDYSATPMCANLGLAPRDARLFMIADGRWKFIHAEGGFRPMLFDRDADPEEFNDLGASEAHAAIIDDMYARLGDWARREAQRTTISDAQIERMRKGGRRKGILLGLYDGSEVEEELTIHIRGKVGARPDPHNV
ncbi:phosphonate monoester hydrolase [Defluviimonas sp. 20V17]|uniref:Arylsulfatase A n=1 Tax=Allgaiera indica TaxID=765699 RepID=A0AAN4URZ1_9RHOB|nr:alkaline phosphatase family protein [Allgaiera indica]KDB04137.1 phosphonate monoester hydrolase [Defluviimonas sp. 20V17]GHE02325.1 phosphonate monoester hydrolase [Allgaiera indica]SDX95969.1 Arylsulfatase A [Allgaiera indica]